MVSLDPPNEPTPGAVSPPPPAPEGTLPAPPLEPARLRERGWLLPGLLQTDTLLYGRWDYLADCWERGELPETPLPRIHFLSVPEPRVWKMLTAALDAIPQHGTGGWRGWSSSEYLRFFLEWLLHGFGHVAYAEPPKEPAGCEGAAERLACRLDLPLLQQHPYDYLGDLLAQNLYGKRQGFFPIVVESSFSEYEWVLDGEGSHGVP